MDRLLDHFVRDFISNWYDFYDVSKTREFQSSVRALMRHVMVEFGLHSKRANATSIALPLFQVVIVHMRQYRDFELSSLPLQNYLLQNPTSSFARLQSTSELAHRLRELSTHLAVRLLPPSDRSSPVAFSFAREILATTVLMPMIESFSDPDFINQKIVGYLGKREEKMRSRADRRKNEGKARRRRRGDGSENKIFVKIVEARRLPITGSANLYCSILCGTSLQKTRKVNAESSPMWSEEFHFDWKGGSGVEGIVIDIMEAKVIRDEIVGSIYIPLTLLPANKYVKEWRPLDTSDSKFSSAVSSELLVEAIHIVTGAEGDVDEDDDEDESSARPLRYSSDEGEDEDRSKRRSTSTSPTRREATPEIDPRNLSLEDVLQRSEGMVEFMQYLDSVDGTDYVQMYLMIDSFRQLAQVKEPDSLDGMSHSSLQTLQGDAMAVWESFFGEEGRYGVEFEGMEGIGDRVRRNIEQSPGAGVFDELQAKIVEVVKEKFWEGFKRSEVFKAWVAERGGMVDESASVTGDAARPLPPRVNDQPPPLPVRTPGSSPLRRSLDLLDDGNADSAQPRQLLSSSPSTSPTAQPPRTPERPQFPQRTASSQSAASLSTLSSIEPPQPVALPLPRHITETQTRHTRKVSTSSQLSTNSAVTARTDDEEAGNLGLTPEDISRLVERLERAHEDEGNIEGQINVREELRGTIAMLKTQVASLEREMQSFGSGAGGDAGSPPPDPERLTQLAELKVQIRTQIEMLTDIAEEAEDAGGSYASSPSTSGTGLAMPNMSNWMPKFTPPALDLQNIIVRVLDASADIEEENLLPDQKNNKSLFQFQSSIPAVSVKGLLYMIQVERLDGKNGWLLTKTYADFHSLFTALRTAHPKSRRIEFPLKVSKGVKGREALAADMERWLNVVVGDEELRGDEGVKNFMKPENILKEGLLGLAGVQGVKGQQEVQRKVFGALRSAGSVLKRVATSAGNTPIRAAGLVASGVTGVANAGGASLRKRASRDVVRRLDGGDGEVSSREASVGRGGRADEDFSVPHRGSSLDADQSTGAADTSIDSIDSPSSAPAKPPSGSKFPARTSSMSPAPSSHPAAPSTIVLTDAELEIILECAFGFIDEVFHLSDPNRWIRQKGLHVVKTLLRRTYGGRMAGWIQKKLGDATGVSSVAGYVESIDEMFWPGGIWWQGGGSSPPADGGDAKSTDASQQQPTITSTSTEPHPSTIPPPPPRTEEDKAETRRLAKRLFLSPSAITGLDAVQKVVGTRNTTMGMTRLFNMLQEKELNRVLVVGVLEAVLKGLVS
ncbi:sorting nexin 13 [Rhizophlyctis rosea]|uniref:Sorting nexin 13 n=1 Tax=Rhizophlyctis rosea TaxID=64517 RepID=A0AAD5SI81_9FUNG|nr:sorting nexin 13 [Rhizophlyctis rosea]